MKKGRNDFGKGANDHRRVRSLKGRDIGTVVDDERVAIVSGESEKSRVVPLCDISRRGVKIPINIVLVARKGGKDKNLGTSKRSHRRGRGRSVRRIGGGREGVLVNRIHYVFFAMSLAGREPQCQVDNKGKNDRADDTNRRALGIDGNHHEEAGREGDDGDDDG